MATSSRRDVTLGVSIKTTGEESLTGLARDLRDIGQGAGASSADVDRLAAELDQLAAATMAARDAERTARSEAAAAKAERDRHTAAVSRFRIESDRATRQTAEWQAQERALRLALEDSKAAVRTKEAAVKSVAAATRAAAAAEADHVATIRRTAEAARASAAQQITAGQALRGELDGIGAALRRVQSLAAVAIGGSVLGGMVGDVARTADEYANLAARIKIATGEGQAFESALSGVVSVAERTSASLDTTASLFTRITQAGRELNLSQRDSLALVETINQAVALGGQSAESSDAAIRQLIQGLQSGVLRGEEFNSVMEQAPRLAVALADGLGVSTGALRQMANQGQLTAQTVIAALSGQAQTVAAEFDKLPPTVGRALQNLSTQWTVYVGEVDQATGASATAAKAIDALAGNLDTLGTLLYSAGKAAAAWQALKLAQTMLGIATATRAATVETTALAAAQTAATAATAGNVAAAGRFAALLSGLKVGALLAIITNFRELGTWIGETAARLAGFDDRLKETEASLAADDRAARATAASVAALAQESAKAAEAAAGLTAESRRIVGEFDQVRAKGESVADALGKVAKALDLSDVSGITAAGVALDVLAQRGAITGQQLRDTLAGALKDADLGVFEAQARAAFDGSEQGVRRLAAALDALADESLRRVGTSAREIGTGFSEAASSAINDVDALAQTLAALGADAATTGRLLAAALDRATDAAQTERAVQTVIERIEELGRAGKLSGEALAGALDAARRKLDEIRPGVDSLSDALRAFGLKTREELQQTADKLGAAYKLISQSVTVSLSDKVKAFEAYRDAAIAANGGVESSELKLQRVILENKVAAAGLGETIKSAMKGAKDSTDAATLAQERYNKAMRDDPSRLVGGSGLAGIGSSPTGLTSADAVGGADGFSDFDSADYRAGAVRDGGGFQVDVPEGYYYTLNPSDPGVERRAGYTRSGQPIPGYFARKPGYVPTGGQGGPFGGSAGSRGSATPAGAATVPASAPVAAPPEQVVRVELTLAGRAASVPTTQEGAAALLRLLEEAQLAGGG